jgi:predicted SnoaL-like aldol condensation-catalyzing enzyme
MDETKVRECARIHDQWHEFSGARNAQALIGLYADDATLETPLVMAILDDKQEGVLRGREEIMRFFVEGLRRRPDEFLRWYRTGRYFTDGTALTWEYPRQTPQGEQIELIEMMDVCEGKIKHHRIYWGWFGFQLLLNNAVKKAVANQSRGAV